MTSRMGMTLAAKTGRALKPHNIAMTLLVMVALAAGWMMLPGESERIAMLELDGKNREALRSLEARYAAGDRRHRTLFQLQALYEQFGDLPQARQMLEMLAQARPRDAQVQRQLATFYKMTQDAAGYNRQLRVQIATRYSEVACRELISLERLKGEYDAEQQAIEFCRQRGYRRTDDLLRLASLQASHGALTSAAALLRSIDDLRRLKVPQDRLQLFAVLLKLEQPREALRRGLRWLRLGRDEAFSLTLVEMLVDADRTSDALQMARQAGTPGDLLSLVVADLLLETDQQLAARTYLKGWIEGSSLRDADMAGHFIAIALDAEDAQLAYEGAKSFGIGKVAQVDLVALAEALAVTRRTSEFEAVRAMIEPQTLAANPLLAAAAAMRQPTPATPAAAALLKQVSVNDLDTWRLTLWSQLMRDAGKQADATAELERLGIETYKPVAARAGKAVARGKRTRRVRAVIVVAKEPQETSSVASTAARKVAAKGAKAAKPARPSKGTAPAVATPPKSVKYSAPFDFFFK